MVRFERQEDEGKSERELPSDPARDERYLEPGKNCYVSKRFTIMSKILLFGCLNLIHTFIPSHYFRLANITCVIIMKVKSTF